MSKRNKVSNFDELRKNLSGYTDQHMKEKAAARIDEELKRTVTLNNDTKAPIEEIKTLINNEIDYLKHTLNYLNKNEFEKAWNTYTIALNNHQKAIIKQMENHLYIHSEVDDHEFENERFTSQFEERNEHHLVFILPQMLSINLGDRGFYNAKLIAYLSRKLISEYALKKGELSYFKNPVILFEHHVKKNSSFNGIYDSDNLDSKKFVDELQGYIFPDDTCLNISLMHLGIIDDISFTEIHVMEMVEFKKYFDENFIKFLQKNS